MKHNYILLIGIILCIIYLQLYKNIRTNETFIDYSQEESETIFIIMTKLIRPWERMFYSYRNKNIILYKKLIIGNIDNKNTLLGFINSSNLINLDNKVFFTKFMEEYKKSYYPETYIFENKKFNKKIPDEKSLYYVKNTTTQLYGGKGIYIFKNPKNINKFVNLNNTKNFIIQKDIGKPYLNEQRKSDLRFYLLVVNINGTVKIYLYNDGFLKMAPNKYDDSSLDKKTLLTNNTQRKDTMVDNKLVSSLKDKDEIFNKSKDLLTNLSKSLKEKITEDLKNKDTFQIHVIGQDIIFDEKMNPYLLELNIGNPAFILKKNNPEIKLLKYKIANDIVNNFVLSYMNNKKINEEDSNFIKLV